MTYLVCLFTSEVKSLSRVRLFAYLWTVAYQAPPSISGIFQARVLEWVAISFSRGIFPTQGLNPGLPHCRQTLLPSEPPGKMDYALKGKAEILGFWGKTDAKPSTLAGKQRKSP